MSPGWLGVICLFLPTLAVGTNVSFVTKQQVDDPSLSGIQYDFVCLSKFGFRADQTTSVIFQVRACQDARVCLMENVGDYSTMYDIGIGAWANTIYNFIYRYHGVEQYDIPSSPVTPPLNCNAYRMFVVTWHNGDIDIWSNKDGTMAMFTTGWTLPPTYQVRDVGFTTAVWAEGYWKLNVPNSKATSASLWTTFRKYEGIRMRNGILWTTPAINRAMCGLLCHMDVACWSFTYNTAEKTCQGHDDIFASEDEGAGEGTPSSSYFVLLG